MDIQQLINSLTPENLAELNAALAQQQNKIPVYTYSQMTFKILSDLFKIRHYVKLEIFDAWFNDTIDLNTDDKQFLSNLILQHEILIDSYKEEDLKVKFITPILNRIQFLDFDIPFRDFYEEPLTYTTEHFVLTGTTDFIVAKGLEFPIKPYFFIQEFKKSIKYDDPRPQLIAEMIAAIELNQCQEMKGAYIVGALWHFIIVEKIETQQYQYAISRLFNATNIIDLQHIYKNLLFIKKEIYAAC